MWVVLFLQPSLVCDRLNSTSNPATSMERTDTSYASHGRFRGATVSFGARTFSILKTRQSDVSKTWLITLGTKS
jgi:hypothetical protein